MPDLVYDKIVERIDCGEPLVVALVLEARGSTPQCAGARAIIEASGRLWGTIGGGMVEAEAKRRAVEACRTGQASIFDCEMTNLDAAVEGAVCGGTMRVLVDPTVARHRSRYEAAAGAVRNRRRGCLLTRTRRDTGDEVNVEVQWLAEPSFLADVAPPIRSCLESGRPASFIQTDLAGAAEEVFIEPVRPQPLLVIAGGGHVGRAVALLALEVGFDVTLIDDRPEFADPARFPSGIQVLCGPVPERVAACPLDAETFVVLVTRGHRHDAEALAECIHRPLAYLGMIGSRRKVALVRQKFLDCGLATKEELDRMRAPIGLDLGAVTVPEIAVSIVAQLIAVRRKGPLA